MKRSILGFNSLGGVGPIICQCMQTESQFSSAALMFVAVSSANHSSFGAVLSGSNLHAIFAMLLAILIMFTVGMCEKNAAHQHNLSEILRHRLYYEGKHNHLFRYRLVQLRVNSVLQFSMLSVVEFFILSCFVANVSPQSMARHRNM